MNSSGGIYNRLRRFIAERLRITSTVVLVAFLIITCLAIWAMFSNPSCSLPKPTRPAHTRPAPTPTGISTSTSSQTPTPTLLPPVTLREPENGSVFDSGAEVILYWSSPYALQANEYYRLRVWAKEQSQSLFYCPEEHFRLPALLPGEYNWAIAVVRYIGQDVYKLVSEESDWWSFTAVSSSPVVHSISPTSILKGTGGPVVISGENFTHTLLLTIGVSLRAVYVNSNTIMVAIPMTLEVGEYPVIVTDLNGKGVSFASFAVKEQPTPTPDVTHTPRPSQYPPPVLDFGGIIACNVVLRWQWPGTLAENEWFAVRVEEVPDVPHSQAWVKEREYIYSLSDAGDYVWEVAICRGDPSAGHCSQDDELAVSERGVFSFGGCAAPKPTPP